ncbi:MAG: hypothetical protein GY786_15280 [Proteobacteria bacterium]|nr:hypothetical protein [Pseudomonadota bacterium]
MRSPKLFFLTFFVMLTLGVDLLEAAFARRTHQFPRAIAMGDAFVAVGDSMGTIAYNPAGILMRGVEWDYHMPLFVYTYDELIRNSIKERKLDIVDFDDPDSLDNLPGTRAYFEFEFPFLPYVFVPNQGWFFGLTSNNWIEFVFPDSTTIPDVLVEVISNNVAEFAMAQDFFSGRLKMGFNAKAINRVGVLADISLLRLDSLEIDEIYDEYNTDPPADIVPSFDFGVLYTFDMLYKPRIGISATDIGDLDFGSAGSVKQLNTIGAAATQIVESLKLTYSLDYRDYTYSYFSSDSLKQRINVGFEVAFRIQEDNIAFQMGLKELQYLSYGLSAKVGWIQFNTLQWTENFGTDKNPSLDKRYMFQLALEF